jgi:hypothetical protein
MKTKGRPNGQPRVSTGPMCARGSPMHACNEALAVQGCTKDFQKAAHERHWRGLMTVQDSLRAAQGGGGQAWSNLVVA